MVILFRLHTFSTITLLGLPGISTTRESRGEGEHPHPSSLKRSGCSAQFPALGALGCPLSKPLISSLIFYHEMDFELYEMCFLYKLIEAYDISSSVNLLWKIT